MDTSHLSPMQYAVTQEKATEPPGTGALLHNMDTGAYTCVVCGQEIFSSQDKYDSDKWPSFTKPVADGRIKLLPDDSHGMQRTEVICGNCGAHLGHVFGDGRESEMALTSQDEAYYCINSAALNFKAKSDTEADLSKNPQV